MPEINGHDYGTGCYVSGHWGQYGASRVLRIADDILGTTFYDDAAAAMLADHDPADPYSSPLPTDGCVDELPRCEIVFDAADDAETALNDATPDGYGWHRYGGEFFLSPWCDDETGDGCADETCACRFY